MMGEVGGNKFSSTNQGGNGNPLQYSCLENPLDRGAWWAAVHGVVKSRTWLNSFTFTRWRRKWQPTPVFLPGESQGWQSLWAAIYGVTQSRTQLKRLSSSSNQGGETLFYVKNTVYGTLSELRVKGGSRSAHTSPNIQEACRAMADQCSWPWGSWPTGYSKLAHLSPC